jgi:transmembrane 9 superfamily protein 2/4
MLRWPAAAAALALLLLLIAAASPTAAFYLPGVAPNDFQKVRSSSPSSSSSSW